MPKSTPRSPTIEPILFLGTQMEIGGAQKILLEQAAWYHRKGYVVFVVFFYDKYGLEEKWQKKYGFPIINLQAWELQSFSGLNFLRLIFGCLQLIGLILREKIQTIQTYTSDSNLLGIPIAWLCRVQFRIAIHQGQIPSRAAWLGKLHAHMVNWGIASRLVVVSEDLARYVIKIDGVKPAQIKIIHNGFSLDLKPNQTRETFSKELNLDPEKTFFALTSGRLSEQKSHHTLLDAIPEVLDAIPEILFLFAGEGDKRNALEKKSERLGIQKHVLFLGIREDIHNIMEFSDLLIMPSLWEGFSLAMLEGMASGLPVVGSDVVGIKELVGDNERGILVPSQNPDALAKAIIQIVKDDETRDWLSKQGRKYVRERFSMDAMCQKYEDFLIQLSM